MKKTKIVFLLAALSFVACKNSVSDFNPDGEALIAFDADDLSQTVDGIEFQFYLSDSCGQALNRIAEGGRFFMNFGLKSHREDTLFVYHCVNAAGFGKIYSGDGALVKDQSLRCPMLHFYLPLANGEYLRTRIEVTDSIPKGAYYTQINQAFTFYRQMPQRGVAASDSIVIGPVERIIDFRVR